ncbi:hypothetical protein VTK73DRAFT_9747 [Phialemonium thermophilum]|uniref:Uncharacterized protein n=1 Tax=Phialemonium thermophilum TaxID=223376 RepID=A0ABR3W0M1_9PEZI
MSATGMLALKAFCRLLGTSTYASDDLVDVGGGDLAGVDESGVRHSKRFVSHRHRHPCGGRGAWRGLRIDPVNDRLGAAEAQHRAASRTEAALRQSVRGSGQGQKSVQHGDDGLSGRRLLIPIDVSAVCSLGGSCGKEEGDEQEQGAEARRTTSNRRRKNFQGRGDVRGQTLPFSSPAESGEGEPRSRHGFLRHLAFLSSCPCRALQLFLETNIQTPPSTHLPLFVLFLISTQMPATNATAAHPSLIKREARRFIQAGGSSRFATGQFGGGVLFAGCRVWKAVTLIYQSRVERGRTSNLGKKEAFQHTGNEGPLQSREMTPDLKTA